jgi:DNA topoisomerase-1
MTARQHALVIVESPAKARTIAGYLGDGYVVEPSIGHIRDLPKRAEDVPLAMKKLEWAKLGVDVQNDFKPLYVVDSDKRQQIAKLKSLLKGASTLYLATDEDREGEAIAWHLSEVLQPKIPTKRMVFHEITKKAIREALDAPREIDRRLVDAQEARRILDRLYGYEVSPVLWKKVLPKLSAGRVQSVATRIVVERERERMAFVKAVWWDLSGTLKKADAPPDLSTVPAALAAVEGKRLASGKDFDSKGKLEKDALVLGAEEAGRLAEELRGRPFTVRSVERKPYKRTPHSPFMTSTLQQEASRKLRFSAQRAMKAAQRLYEQGLITYMRTDSTTLSEAALTAARTRIEALYGKEYLPAAPRRYQNKVKNAQEAHEAIRPAGEAWPLPEEVAAQVGPDEAKVYELVWKRTVASQMQDARGESVQVRFDGATAAGKKVELTASGNTIEFPGYLRAYVEGSDDPEAELEGREKHLPPLAEGDVLEGVAFEAEGHETQPPARYTEASLVRRLEELGVGRPSTYASTISTIQDRGYVWRKGTALVPSFTAFAVVTLLEKHFPELVDYAFTAKMEDDLDAIASGDERAVPWLKRFYFGSQHPGAGSTGSPLELGLKALVSGENLGDIDARAVNSIPLGKDENGVDVLARVGRYGPYLARGEDTVSIPEDLPPDELTVARAVELLSAPKKERVLGIDPATKLEVLLKAGRFGTYVQLGPVPEKGKKDEKPKTSSLFSTMTADTLTFEQALMLLSLPRVVGKAEDGEEIVAQNGRFGPYIQKGKETRSLEREEQIFSVTVEEALKLLAAPKDRRRRQGPAKGPLKELGEDPVSKKTIQLKDGRFGPYVTDGETIASLRRGDSVDSITPERAQELLAERRERGPSTKRGRGRGARPKREPAAKASKKKGSLTEAVEKIVQAGDKPKKAARARAKRPPLAT